MSSRRVCLTTLATVFLLSVVGPHPPGVWAQNSNDQAVCRPGWEWSDNSLGQDPCLISSLLDAACRGYGSWTVPAMNSTQEYTPPSADVPYDFTCHCNTVQYSLLMACTTCQGGVIYSWTGWAANCDSVSLGQYPENVPYGTAIPQWALYDVTKIPNMTYNYTLAISIGRDPEEKPAISSTTSHTVPTTTSLPTTTSQPGSTSTPATSGSTTNNTPAIVGGVVGGVVPLIILGVLVTLWLKHRKPERPTSGMPDYHHYSGQPVSPSIAASTIPASTGPTYTTYYPANGNQGHVPRLYNGMPEI